MDTKLIGGILLIVGTSIGAGMLALPIANSMTGFIYSSLLLFVCWFLMTASAFLILEVNLWLQANNNIISMAKVTLGSSGQVIAWLTYLLLLYSLLSAYIAGGADFFQTLVAGTGFHISHTLSMICFTGVLGTVVYQGIRSVDYINRGLMFVKFSTLLILLVVVLTFVSPAYLLEGNAKYFASSTTVAITSFGFATIIPSLRSYFQSDIAKLRKAILIGSLIPLICYIAWDLAIMGTIPRNGSNGLIAMNQSGHSTSDFVIALSTLLQRNTITIAAKVFTSICLATSFLGVALCLSDFLADGFQVKPTNKGKLLVNGATFLPPFIIVLLFPGAFIAALSYAGIYCVILLVLLPALMAWRGRYHLHLAGTYQLVGGKPLLLTLLVIGVLIICQPLLPAVF